MKIPFLNRKRGGDVKEYVTLKRSLMACDKRVSSLASDYELHKSMVSGIESDPLEIQQKKFQAFNAFMKQQKNDVQALLKEKMRVERRLDSLSKSLPSEDVSYIDRYFTLRQLQKNGKVGMNVLDDFIVKAKKVVPYSDVIVQDKDGYILLLHRRNCDAIKEHGEWCLPGGHVDPGEEHDQAATRELYEETGITLDGDTICDEVGFFKNDTADIKYYRVVLEDRPTVLVDDSEHDGTAWVKPAELKDYALIYDLGDTLRKIFFPEMTRSENLAKALKEGKISPKLFREVMGVKEEKSMGVADVETLAPESLDGEEKKLVKSFVLSLGFTDIEQADRVRALIDQAVADGELTSLIETKTDVVEVSVPEEMINEVSPVIVDKQTFINYLNIIEGAKTRIKGLHWAEEDNSKHVYLDELGDTVSEFEDKFAEVVQSSLGRFDNEEIQGTLLEVDDPITLVGVLIHNTNELRNLIESLPDRGGEVSLLDDFLANLKQSMYRFQMH